ncbi:transposase [Streptomyces sp. NPDC002669]|uniref:transposase n=1 Tax=Streptomyces sp. NPDC002669 TaxID=3364658 RepID=UPI003682DD61
MSGTTIEQEPAGEPAAVAVPTSDEQLVAMLVDRTRSEGLRPAFAPDDCRQCPVKTACTHSDARKVTFLPRGLYDIQSESRTGQQTQERLSRHPLRAAIESTISEFVNGHGMRQCRYRNQSKAHVQHVLTAIAVNLERIDVHLPTPPAHQPEP